MASADRASFLPELCAIRAQFTVVMMGQLLAFVLTLARAGFSSQALPELALLSLYIQWIGLSVAGVLCLARPLLARRSELAEAFLAYGLVLGVAGAVSEVGWWLVTPLGADLSVLQIGHWALLGRTLGIAAIVGAVVLRYFYVQHHWQERTAAAAAAQLQALQARIRPHFLFNCMNTIASLARSDPPTAERAIEDLSDLLRASLANPPHAVLLEDEIALVKRYLAIEALRLGSRLQVAWQVDGLPGDLQVPPLSLQPLVENAIHHGIEPLAGGGLIRIEAECQNGRLSLSVTNPLAGPGSLQAPGNRLAQDNLRQRLKARYGEQAGLRITAADHEYRATMYLPGEPLGDEDRDRR